MIEWTKSKAGWSKQSVALIIKVLVKLFSSTVCRFRVVVCDAYDFFVLFCVPLGSSSYDLLVRNLRPWTSFWTVFASTWAQSLCAQSRYVRRFFPLASLNCYCEKISLLFIQPFIEFEKRNAHSQIHFVVDSLACLHGPLIFFRHIHWNKYQHIHLTHYILNTGFFFIFKINYIIICVHYF